MSEALLAKFQVRCRVQEKSEYQKKDKDTGESVGPLKHGMKFAFEGGMIEVFGQEGDKFYDQCPDVTEECLVAGVLSPSRQSDFGRPLYSLSIVSIGPVTGSRKAA